MLSVLSSLIVISVAVIILTWMFTYSYRHIPDSEILDLSTDNNMLFGKWLSDNIKTSLVIDLDDFATAADFLQRNFQEEIQPSSIVVGENLQASYYKLTKKYLVPFNESTDKDRIFHLRDIIGISGEIAVISDPTIVASLRRSNEFSMNQLHSMISVEGDKLCYNYLQNILTNRWKIINDLQSESVINSYGSYLYLKNVTTPNVQVHQIDKISRINLLCTDLQFKTLIQRIKSGNLALSY